MGLQVRNGWYYFYKRVPTHVSEYDSKNFVRVSLKTKDKFEAQKKAVIYEEEYNKFWQSLIQRGVKARDADYKKAIALAHMYGFAYKNARNIADTASYGEIVKRMEHADKPKTPVETQKAILGITDIPQTLLSECEELFWKQCADRFANKSPHQIIKYKNPRNKALAEFIQIIGDRDLSAIERKDILTFHSWLLEQISKGTNADTANKKMRHVKDILRTVANSQEIPFDEDVLFARTRFKLIHKSRPPFEADYVETKLLPGLNNLNDDARLFVYAMADTGAREAELAGLTSEDIFLDAEIPHIWIRPKDKRELKTRHSERQIPLVGTALYAFKHRPHGFNRYKEADSISALVNKYLSNNKLRPTPEHSLYSLRHTFKDRLRDVQAPEEIIDQLMGHRIAKPRYGRGHLLKTSQEWLEKIAFTVPDKTT